MADQEREGFTWVERLQHCVIVLDKIEQSYASDPAQPYDHNWRKRRCNLSCSQWLDKEQQDKGAACSSHDRRSLDGSDDVQPLVSSKHRLRRCQDAVGHHQRHSQYTDYLQHASKECAFLNAGTDRSVPARHFSCEHTLYLERVRFFRVDVG